MSEREPRERGLIFGRGDDLPEGTVEPPLRKGMMASLYGPAAGFGPIAFRDPPPEPVEVVGEIPWELRDGPDDEASPSR